MSNFLQCSLKFNYKRIHLNLIIAPTKLRKYNLNMNSKPIRVLNVFEAVFNGGVENLIANIYDHIPEYIIASDIAYHDNGKVSLENVPMLTSKWPEPIAIPSFNTINAFSYRKWWKEFIETSKHYDIVHIHYIDSAFCYIDLFRKNGTKVILHSHNTIPNSIGGKFSQILAIPSRSKGSFFLACSKLAGIERFGKKIARSNKFRVFLNGIDTQRFRFDADKRISIRKEYGISDDITIIGHIGRFAEQKNHTRILEIFNEFHKANTSSELWLIGNGPLLESTKEKCRELGLEEAVRFLGTTNHPEDYIQGFDLFLFPSIFEGFGIVLIEAQCSGLPCIVSEAIQIEADTGSELIFRAQLSDNNSVWTSLMKEALLIKRTDKSLFIKDQGFDIKRNAEDLIQLYSCLNNEND